MGLFGDKLRKQRELRGLALESISNTTKISTRMLRALEDEHFDQLPGGVFNKGFVRAYARQVGLNEEEAVTDYLAALRESQIQQQAILPDFRGSNHIPDAPAPRIPPGGTHNNAQSRGPVSPPVLPSNVTDTPAPPINWETKSEDVGYENAGPTVSTAESAVDPDHHQLQVEDFSQASDPSEPASNEEQFRKPTPPPTQPSWGKLVLALAIVVIAVFTWGFVRGRRSTRSPQIRETQSQTTAPPVGALPQYQGISSQVASARQTKPLDAKLASNSPSVSRSIGEGNHAVPVPKSLSRSSHLKPPASFTLLIRAEKTTWVSIVADGAPVASETLIAPAHTSVRATKQVSVKIGNAAGVSFELNGKALHTGGNDGEVRTYVFDSTGLHEPPSQSLQ